MLNNLIEIIKTAGEQLLEYRKEKLFEGKWEGAQFKAEADKLMHNELTTYLKKIDESIPIISEEDESSLVVIRPEKYWIIDPIDGTASFVKGYDGFVTQAALIENNIPVLSAIYAPALNKLFYAELGSGAFLNGEKIKVTKKENLEILIDNYPEPRGIANKVFDELYFKKYVECGSIALKICMVASGNADLFLKDVPVRDWDLAAPQLILSEAGGVITNVSGNNFEYRGDYEHQGIICTTSDYFNDKVRKWFRSI